MQLREITTRVIKFGDSCLNILFVQLKVLIDHTFQILRTYLRHVLLEEHLLTAEIDEALHVLKVLYKPVGHCRRKRSDVVTREKRRSCLQVEELLVELTNPCSIHVRPKKIRHREVHIVPI